MTTIEAAAALGLSRNTIQVQIRAGRLAATKIGRDYYIDPAEVERYRVESKGRPGAPKKSAALPELP